MKHPHDAALNPSCAAEATHVMLPRLAVGKMNRLFLFFLTCRSNVVRRDATEGRKMEKRMMMKKQKMRSQLKDRR